jgi:hypothetical protein
MVDAKSFEVSLLFTLSWLLFHLYLTFTEYSGITAQSLNDVLASIQEVQVALLGLISKEDIIVGHSLENDLHALRLSHLYVVDTAVLFRSGGRKHALR